MQIFGATGMTASDEAQIIGFDGYAWPQSRLELFANEVDEFSRSLATLQASFG